MSHLQLVADNAAVPHPYRSRRELRDRRAALGIVAHSGGRMMPVPLSVFEPERTLRAAIARGAAVPVSDFVSPGLRPVGPANSTGPRVHVPMTAHDNYIINREE